MFGGQYEAPGINTLFPSRYRQVEASASKAGQTNNRSMVFCGLYLPDRIPVGNLVLKENTSKANKSHSRRGATTKLFPILERATDNGNGRGKRAPFQFAYYTIRGFVT